MYRTIIKILYPPNAGYEENRAKYHDFMLMVLKDPVIHQHGRFSFNDFMRKLEDLK